MISFSLFLIWLSRHLLRACCDSADGIKTQLGVGLSLPLFLHLSHVKQRNKQKIFTEDTERQ